MTRFSAPPAATPALLPGSANVRFFDRAPENGRWSGASQRRHRSSGSSMRCWRCRARPSFRENQRALAYLDLDLDVSEGGVGQALPDQAGGDRARCCRRPRSRTTDNVLVVGCATGYAAAVVAKLAGAGDGDRKRFGAGREGQGRSGRARLGQCDGQGAPPRPTAIRRTRPMT